jgi:hypothetical protein
VGSGNQVPGTCSVSGATLSCSASYSTATLAAGTYPISVVFEGDPNYPQSSATANLTVTQAPSMTVVTGGSFPYNGNPHPATVSVTGAGGLSLSPAPIYSGSCTSAPVTVPQGASCTASYTYAGDANHTGSSGSATITITPVYVKSVVLHIFRTELAYPGETNTVTCVIPATRTPATGTIQIMDGTTVLNTLSLRPDGCAYWFISPGLAIGTHSLSSFYSGDKNNPFGWSTPVLVTVTPAPVRLAVSCSKPFFPYGGNYQCTVDARADERAGAVTGSITYSLDSSPAVAIPLNGGNAQFTIVKPPVGSHTVTIVYAQQGNFAAAGPTKENFTVTPAPGHDH